MSSADSPHRPSRKEALDVAGVLGAAVAHELRNMLASASSSIFLAKRDVDKRDRLLGHLDSAEAEMQRSQDVIERVLRLVRGESIHREPCRIADVINDARRNVRGQSARIEVEVVPADLEVLCEPLLVERLITNLLLNAIEAARPGSSGTIIVRACTDTRWFVLEVQDDGPGFEASILAHLFEPGVTTKSTGSGVGLVLCRAIARVHGGDMYVEPVRDGGALVRCVFSHTSDEG